MSETRERARIREILRGDERWSVYALGDLADRYFRESRWFAADSGAPALVLLYGSFDPPVLFTFGGPEAVAPLIEEAAAPRVYLHVRPEIVPVLARRYTIAKATPMLRMTLAAGAFRPAECAGAVRLGPDDLDALVRLYADGEDTGEAPDFFFPSMLETGVFYGALEVEELAAAAGTHLVTPEEGVAAVGCVYTRRDRRGRGLAASLTSAVVSELEELGVRTIALNVKAENETAIRIYERLGFSTYCGFLEGLAFRFSA